MAFTQIDSVAALVVIDMRKGHRRTAHRPPGFRNRQPPATLTITAITSQWPSMR
jgi:hypothetical protein